MKHSQTITLPALVKEVGNSAIVEATGCDRTLPTKWAHGQRPGWKNAEKLVQFAASLGYTLEIIRGIK